MAAETQAFIDEVKANGAPTRARANAAFAALVPEVGAIAREIELLAQLLAASEISEANAELHGKMEEGFQKLNAARRQAGEIEGSGRAFVANLRQLMEWWADFREKAKAAGYTV